MNFSWTHESKFKKDHKTKIRNWRSGKKYEIIFHLLSGAFTVQVNI